MKLYNTSHTHWKSMVDGNDRPTQAQALARRLDDEYRDGLCKWLQSNKEIQRHLEIKEDGDEIKQHLTHSLEIYDRWESQTNASTSTSEKTGRILGLASESAQFVGAGGRGLVRAEGDSRLIWWTWVLDDKFSHGIFHSCTKIYLLAKVDDFCIIWIWNESFRAAVVGAFCFLVWFGQ
jgi:hypothetical protein